MAKEEFTNILGPKTRFELARISCAVMGIEFAYAAETAFVSPLLLNLGLKHSHMTLIWILSPLCGMFITPILGSLSDGCTLRLGRRRPFILLLSIGIIIGLILVPNGENIGYWLGDKDNTVEALNEHNGVNVTSSTPIVSKHTNSHPWGIFFAILGTVLLDFDADACQSPARAYMLDVTIPEDHARGLSTFTIMAGIGGSFGYLLGAMNWEHTIIGHVFGGQIRAVFTLVLLIFVVCVLITVTSCKEKTLTQDREERRKSVIGISYGTLTDGKPDDVLNNNNIKTEDVDPTFCDYVKTILNMPSSLKWLCFTNFFSWMSLVCYSLYFTDFVGESVFGGNPASIRGSILREKFDDGVRFGCYGMSLYSLTCAIYSFCTHRLIELFGAKKVYFYGQLTYALGMVCMGIFRHPIAVIIFSCSAGIMYSTLFTMPYLLVAKYHETKTFSKNTKNDGVVPEVRGLGTDLAVVSSMVFVAQITQALILGHLAEMVGSITSIVYAASVFATCGAIASTQVLYLDK